VLFAHSRRGTGETRLRHRRDNLPMAHAAECFLGNSACPALRAAASFAVLSRARPERGEMPVPPDPRGIGQGFGAGKACFADVLIPGAAGESFRRDTTWSANAPIGLSRQGIPAALRAGLRHRQTSWGQPWVRP
jgi:hypothetical protein